MGPETYNGDFKNSGKSLHCNEILLSARDLGGFV